MRIRDFTTPLVRSSDTRAVTVQDDDTVRTTHARALFGHRFRTEGAKNRHRQTIDTFIDAIRVEHGEPYAALSARLLAGPRTSGRPLRKYMIQDILRAVKGERQRIQDYNNQLSDMGTLTDYIRSQPEAEGLTGRLVRLTAQHVKELLDNTWKNRDQPITRNFLKDMTTRCIETAHKVHTAEELISAFKSGAPEGKALADALFSLQEQYHLNEAQMASIRPCVCTLIVMHAAFMQSPITPKILVDFVLSEELPGLKTLFNLNAPEPLEVLDPLFATCPLPPAQIAWLDVVFPNPGIARTLAFRHSVDIFSHVPVGSLPLASDIWEALFKETEHYHNVFPETFATRLEEHLKLKLQEEAAQIQTADNNHIPNTCLTIDLINAGLSKESALRIAGTEPLVGTQDYAVLPLPFNPHCLSLLAADAPSMLEQSIGNHFTSSGVIFYSDESIVEVPIHGTSRIGENHYTRQLQDAETPVEALVHLADRHCQDAPRQRDAVLLLIGPLGLHPLHELSKSFYPRLNEQTGSTVTIHSSGANVLVRHTIHVLHPSLRKTISARVEYAIAPDGRFMTSGVFFAHNSLMHPGEFLSAYLEGRLYSEDQTFRQQGGLPGTLDALAREWNLKAEHLPLLEGFIQEVLPSEFEQSPIPRTLRLLEDWVLDLKPRGLAELIFSLGGPIRRSPAFTTGGILLRYPDISPLDKSWLVRIASAPVPLSLGLQSLDAIKQVDPTAPPFTLQAYWRGVFREPMPEGVTAASFQDKVQERFDAMLQVRLGDLSEMVDTGKGQGTSRSILKDIFLIAGLSIEKALESAITHRGVKTEDFVSLPILYEPPDIPDEYKCLSSLAIDLHRFGTESDPSILFDDPYLGKRKVYPQRQFEMSEQEWENFQKADMNNPVMRALLQHAGNICGENEIQRRALFLALSQNGRLPFRRLCRAVSLEHVLHEHSGCDVVIAKLNNGTISVTYDTLKDNPIRAHIRWVIAPDGLGRCDELSLQLRSQQDNREKRRVRFAEPITNFFQRTSEEGSEDSSEEEAPASEAPAPMEQASAGEPQ